MEAYLEESARGELLMRNSIKLLFVLLFVNSLVIPIGSCEDQFNFVWSIESPVPESNSRYGYQVEIDGDYVIISEPYATVGDIISAGKVYLYDLDGNLLHTFLSPNPETNKSFGDNLALYEDLVAIFEVSKINELSQVAGTIHVYKTDGTHQYTIQSQDIKDSAISARGIGVAFGADILLISEKGGDMMPPIQGKVHIYSQNGEYVNTILSPEPSVHGNFGKTLKVGEEIILISQYGDPERGLKIGPGYVYVHDYDGNHLMTLESPEKEEYACFGSSVSTSMDMIVIGEYKATVNGLGEAGKVHIFNEEGEHLRTLLSPDPEAYALFGSDVAISGDIIVVGEERRNINPFGDEGRAYVFDVNGTLLQNLTAPHPSINGAFGSDVVFQNDVIVVSESSAEVDGQSASGRIHVYKLGAPVETYEPVEEGTTVVTETVTDSETSGGIPGYPIWSIGIALLFVTFFISRTQNDKTLLLSQ